MATVMVRGRIQGEDRRSFRLDAEHELLTLRDALDLITTPEEAAAWRQDRRVTVAAGDVVRQESSGRTLGELRRMLEELGVLGRIEDVVLSWQRQVFGGFGGKGR